MISIFKSLSPLNVLWLALILFALRAGYMVNMPDKTSHAFPYIFNGMPLAFSFNSLSPFFNVLLAGVIVFIQAILLNYMVNHFNLLGKPTFLPALMYITLSGLFKPFLVLSPPLFCNFLVIWMLFKLFSFYKSKDSKPIAFDLGMIVAVGSLVYLPFIFLFFSIWIGLIIFKPFDWREWVSCIIGYLTIIFFIAVYDYVNNSLSQFGNIWIPLSTRFPSKINVNYYNYLVLVPVALIFMLSVIKLQQNFFKSYVQVRKSFQLLFFIFLIAGFSFFVKAAFQLHHFLLCALPASVFFSYYFLFAKSKWFYETLFSLLLIMIVYFQFNTF